ASDDAVVTGGVRREEAIERAIGTRDRRQVQDDRTGGADYTGQVPPTSHAHSSLPRLMTSETLSDTEDRRGILHGTVRFSWVFSLRPSFRLWRDVALTRARLETAAHLYLDLVLLAVALRRVVTEQILAVEFLDDLREGRRQILARAHFRVPASSFLRRERQPGVGHR